MNPCGVFVIFFIFYFPLHLLICFIKLKNTTLFIPLFLESCEDTDHQTRTEANVLMLIELISFFALLLYVDDCHELVRLSIVRSLRFADSSGAIIDENDECTSDENNDTYRYGRLSSGN